jgi:hypothetical protein
LRAILSAVAHFGDGPFKQAAVFLSLCLS